MPVTWWRHLMCAKWQSHGLLLKIISSARRWTFQTRNHNTPLPYCGGVTSRSRSSGCHSLQLHATPLYTGTHMPYGITQCYLPPGGDDILPVVDWMHNAGTASRTVASTNMNATSSRAHTVVTITFDQFISAKNNDSKKTSIINLVDLAGISRTTTHARLAETFHRCFQAASHASHRCGLLLQMSSRSVVCVFSTQMCCAETDEPIEMSFRAKTQVILRDRVLDESTYLPYRKEQFYGSYAWDRIRMSAKLNAATRLRLLIGKTGSVES